MATVNETFDAMPGRFKPDRAQGVKASIQYDITGEGGGTYHVDIAEGKCAVGAGSGRVPEPHADHDEPGLARHDLGKAERPDGVHVGQAQAEG